MTCHLTGNLTNVIYYLLGMSMGVFYQRYKKALRLVRKHSVLFAKQVGRNLDLKNVTGRTVAYDQKRGTILQANYQWSL